MCVDFEPDFSFTENVCTYCKEAKETDNPDLHEDCDDYTEEACACRNFDHKLASKEDFYNLIRQTRGGEKTEVPTSV